MTLNREALAELLGFRLRRVNLALSREFARATGDYGLREGEFTSLATIASSPGISQGGICRVTGLDKSAAVAVIDDLERRGWITRAAPPTTGAATSSGSNRRASVRSRISSAAPGTSRAASSPT